MKSKLFIILLAIPFVLNAQWYKSESVQTLAVFTTSIVLDAVGDGLNDNGQKVAGHFCQAASVGTLLAGTFLIDSEGWGWKVASYVSLRIAIFDPIYNTTRGLPLGYVGDSSMWDKALRATDSPDSWITAGRSLFFVVGISIPINEL